MSEFPILFLGLIFGAVASAAVYLSNAVATIFNRGSPILDLAVRLSCYGAVLMISAECIGHFFGSEVRRHAPWFWSGVLFGFISVPFLTVIGRRIFEKRK